MEAGQDINQNQIISPEQRIRIEFQVNEIWKLSTERSSAFENLRNGAHPADAKLSAMVAMHKACTEVGMDQHSREYQLEVNRELIRRVDSLHRQGDILRLSKIMLNHIGKEKDLIDQSIKAELLGNAFIMAQEEYYQKGCLEIDDISRCFGELNIDWRNQPLLREFIISKISGESGVLLNAIGNEVSGMALSSERGSRGRLLFRPDKTAIMIRTSINKLTGKKSMLAEYMKQTNKTKDTPIRLLLPTSPREWITAQRMYQEPQQGAFLSRSLGFAIQNSTASILLEHGFGGSDATWDENPYLPKLFNYEPQTGDRPFSRPRRLFVLAATKGSKGTTLFERDPKTGENRLTTGPMHIGGLHLAEIMNMFGRLSVPRKKTEGVAGHSQGGQTSLLKLVYGQGERPFTVAVAPVTNNSSEQLILFDGFGRVIPIMAELPDTVHEVVYEASKIPVVEAGERIARSIIMPKGRKHINLSESDRNSLEQQVKLHVGTLKDKPFIKSGVDTLQGHNYFTDEVSEMIRYFFGEDVLILLGGEDAILDPDTQEKDLTRTGWKQNIILGGNWPHHIQNTEDGMDHVATGINMVVA